MAFELPDLPYPHDALAGSGMSKETLEFHHDIHHKAYVDNGNKAIAGTEWESKSVEEIVKGTYQKGAVAQNGIFNNASPALEPHPVLADDEPEAGRRSPASSRRRSRTPSARSTSSRRSSPPPAPAQFGSGWAWLVKDADGSLKVTKTENGVNPLCFGQTALLGCDVWEHSYYIDFRNKRPAYLTNFLDKLVNWENVASRI